VLQPRDPIHGGDETGGIEACCDLMTSSMAGTRGGAAREVHGQWGRDTEEQTHGGGEEMCACVRGGGRCETK
jgi:hypothetical protein